MSNHRAETLVVVGDHVVLVTVDSDDAPTSLEVTLHLDRRRLRSFEEAGWRALRYGLAGITFYWWSARRVVSIAVDGSTGIEHVDVDEDIILAFHRPTGWLLVCETSLRLFLSGREVARLEYPDVLIEAVMHDDQIVVRGASGSPSRVAITSHELNALA